MKNPNGPYPGRQLFLGLTANGNPAFAYLVTGRSPKSRERQATPKENSIIIGPIGDQPYDPLRHYTAVKYDSDTGLLTVSNGIQTEAIYETYRLLYHTAKTPSRSYLKKIMNGAGAEPDSLSTPRISGVVTNLSKKPGPVSLMSIKIAGQAAFVWELTFEAGTLAGISTYQGDMESPKAFDADRAPAPLACDVNLPEELAEYIYEISAALYQGEDIRVCAIGGVRSGDNRGWKTAIINRHKD
jgi:IMP cyclohydrolase